MWRAFLRALVEPPTPTDSAEIVVEFVEDDGRSYRTTYKLVAGVSILQMRTIVSADITRLNNFETVKATIRNAVGNEIIPV